MNERETNPTAAPVANDWNSRSHVRTLVLMGATAVGMYICYRLALPFLAAFTWALALAVLFAQVVPGKAVRGEPSCAAR